MDKYRVRLDNKEFIVDLAQTEEERAQGLKGKDGLEKGYGMLFIFDGVVDTYFTMEDVGFDISIVLLDSMFQVVGYYKAKANDPEPYPCEGVHAVLEVSDSVSIKVGTFLQIKEKVYGEGTMVVLDEKGNVQMSLVGGERIFSRKATKKLIDLVLKANSLKDSDPAKYDAYVDIGLFMFNEFDAQDDRDPEYVQAPN